MIDETNNEEKHSQQKLPNGWVWATIGEICTKPQYGYTTKASSVGKGPQFLRITDITEDRIDWSRVPYCSEPPFDVEKYKLKDGDLVVARAGSVGRAYLIVNPPNAIFASYLSSTSHKMLLPTSHKCNI